ncbi:MAG: NERD domain-containing protein [Clostridia bacterium]|nr:NERD domain-containing protein [Clostridia bacterium]
MPFLIIIPIILIIILAVYLKRPETRGRRGENRVKWVIGETIENEQYVINDLILMNDGKTTQIDHIVINPRGVFVIETKNYSGEIYGNENQREWTQVLAYRNVKNKLYNPLKQNATHVYNVKKVVGKLPVHSLVVFVQNNTHHIESDNVIPLSALRNYLQCGVNILSVKQMKTAYEALLSGKTEITTQEHVRNIREQQRNLERGICPRCGGNLVLRIGKYGEFWGCSNYPKCKFIKKD